MRKKAQFAMEYLLVVGFSVALTIPLIWYLYVGYEDTSRSVNIEQLSEVARELAFQSEKVYYQGPGSRSVVIAHFPEGVEEFKIENHTHQERNFGIITFEYSGFDGTIERVFEAYVCNEYSIKDIGGAHNIKIISNLSTGCIFYESD